MELYKSVSIDGRVFIKVLCYSQESKFPWSYRYLMKNTYPQKITTTPPHGVMEFNSIEDANSFIKKILI